MREGLGPLLVLIGAPGLVCLLSLVTVLFPRIAGAAQRSAAAMPGRSLLLGVVNLLFFTALVVVLTAAGERASSRSGVLEVLALAPALVLGSGLTLGLAAMSALIGDRLVSQRGPISQAVVGAAALVLAGLTPFLGWFLFFPYIALVGLGGVVIGLFSRAPEPPA
ncbi:MAG TPA: hypothetical protein VGA07_03895 [Anaerolineales bacterium]